MNKRYRVMSDEDVTAYKEWAEEKVREWHDSINPNYIFVTETSATPLGFLLKSTWKHAYPEESPPKFCRVDPQQISRLDRPRYMTRIAQFEGFIKSFPHNKNTRAIVIDESVGAGSPHLIAGVVTSLWGIDKEQVTVYCGAPQGYTNRLLPQSSLDKTYEAKHYIRPTVKRKDLLGSNDNVELGHNFKGRIIHDPQLRKRSLDYLHDINLAGCEAGEELKKERQRKNGLEGKVSFSIAILCLLSSMIFLSFNITGNAIGLNRTSTNWIGSVLFIIGLIAYFFWLKTRK